MHTPPAPRFREVLTGLTPFRPSPRPVAPDGTTHLLGANESPHGPLPSVIAAMAGSMAQVHRYPHFGNPVLAAVLADHLGRTPDHVVLGCGSTGLIQTALNSVTEPGGEVVFAWRSFESYPRMVALAGLVPVPVPLRADSHDLDAMAAAITSRTRMVIVCNPNSPTGTCVRREEVERFLDRVPPSCLVLLDEAYREYVRDQAVPDGLTLRPRPNVVVLRTFSKAHGLAGLRVGYAVTEPATAGFIRRANLSFAVNRVAEAAAIASLQAADELRERVDGDVAERDRLGAALRGLGLPVPESQGNFLWVGPGPHLDPLLAECRQRGVAVRAFDGEGARITVGLPRATEAVLAAAAAVPLRSSVAA
jgi:histidinol-phosphate aminotransferase